MNQGNIQTSKRSWAQLFALLLLYCLAVLSIFPPIRALPYFNYIWPVLSAAWLCAAIVSAPAFFIRPTIHQFATYIFFAYTISLAFAAGNGFIGNRYLEIFQVAIFYWAYRINEGNNRQDDNIKLLMWLLPVVLMISLFTVLQYIDHPNISRTAKKDTVVGLSQMSQGVAGYEFIYCLVFLCPPLLYLVINSRRRFKLPYKPFWIAVLTLFLINIAFSNFMTALILTLASIVFRLFIPKITSARFLFYIFALLIIAPFIPYFLLNIIDFGISLTGESMNTSRLLEIRDLLDTGLVEMSMDARLNAFQSSYIAVINNPILGLITSDIGNVEQGLSGFGQHSFLLDNYALYGVFWGSLAIYVFFQPLFRQLRVHSQVKFSLPLLMFALTFLFFLVNNLTPSIGFVVYFAFPVIYGWMVTKIAAKQQVRRG